MPVVAEPPVVAPVVTQATLVTPQLSLTVGSGTTTLASHEPELTPWLILPGQLIVGGVASVTITLWEHVAEFPTASVAVHVTTVVPMGKTDGALLVKAILPGQLSVAVGGESDAVAVQFAPAVRLTVAGQVKVGLTLSTTSTVKLQVAELPAASFTVYVTVVRPALNVNVPRLFTPVDDELPVVAPVKAQVRIVTEQLSAATGLVVTTLALQALAAVNVLILPGHVIVGGTLSVTFTV
jgi:hypothetical protein